MAKQQQPQPQKTTLGPIHKVPCPHCGKPNDFRELNTTDGSTLYPNTEVFCDECGWMMVVVGVQKVTMVRVAPMNKRDPQFQAGGGAPRQAPTLSPAQTRKLLRGR